MLYKNIMVAYDGSEPSEEALAVAQNLIGDDPEAKLHVVSVIPVNSFAAPLDSPIQPVVGVPQVYADTETFDLVLEKAKTETIRNLKESIGDTLSEFACSYDIVAVVAAKPAYGICDYAKENNVDMIVMGRRGLGPLRAMLGSVSYAVLHECDIPVVTVR